MSDAKDMAELAAQVAEKGYDWKQLAHLAEDRAERYLFRLHEALNENQRLRAAITDALVDLVSPVDAKAAQTKLRNALAGK